MTKNQYNKGWIDFSPPSNFIISHKSYFSLNPREVSRVYHDSKKILTKIGLLQLLEESLQRQEEIMAFIEKKKKKKKMVCHYLSPT